MACGVLQFSLQLEGAGIELVILALLGDELFVAAALYYAALLQDHYGLGVADGGETVGYHKDGPARHQGVHSVLDYCLRARVYGRGRFVHYHDRRVGHGGAGYGDELTLALGQVVVVAADHSLVALRQPRDEGVGPRELRRCDALLIRSVKLAAADVVHHRAGKEAHVLEDDAHGAAQVRFAYLGDVYPVVAYLAVCQVVKAIHEIRDSSFACAGGTYEGDFLPGIGVQTDIVQHQLASVIAEIHVVEHHAALHLGIAQAAVVVGVLPGVDVAVGTLYQLPVLLPGPDQGDIALVALRLVVHELEDASRAGKAENGAVHLLGRLGYGGGELPYEAQEGDEGTQRG